jgi:hypothetical protein
MTGTAPHPFLSPALVTFLFVWLPDDLLESLVRIVWERLDNDLTSFGSQQYVLALFEGNQLSYGLWNNDCVSSANYGLFRHFRNPLRILFISDKNIVLRRERRSAVSSTILTLISTS